MKSIKPLFVSLIAICILIPGSVSLMSANVQGPEQAIKETVSNVLLSFPILELYVISVDQDKVILEKDVAGKIRPGVELHVFREGKEFTHPVTGKALGRFEESLGNLRIIDIKENYVEGEIISRKEEAIIKRGDKVRITATKIKLAVFQTLNLSSRDVDEESLTYQLIEELEETNRFEVVQMGELITVLDKLNITDYEQLADAKTTKKLGQLLGVRGLIATQLREIDNRLILEARLLSAYTGSFISKTSVVLPGIKSGYAWNKSAPSSSLLTKGKGLDLSRGKDIFRSEGLDMSIRSLAVGDITGNGQNEIAVTDGEQVTVFSLDGTRLVKLWSEPKAGRNHLSLDVADINHNGTAEIFVTNLVQTSLRSYVLEYGDGEYKKVADGLKYFLRVMNLQNDCRLVGQRMGVSQAFYGDLTCLEWAAGKYVAGEKLKVPPGISIYGFANGDLNNDGQSEVVQIDKFDRLRVYSADAELQWKSAEHYGGYNLFFKHIPRNVFSTSAQLQKPNRVKVRGKIYIRDLDGNGTNEILICKNIPAAGYLFPNISNYTEGRVVNLEWNGLSYVDNWQTRKFNAYIADFAIADIYNDRRKDLVMALVFKEELGKLFGREKSVIIFYQL